MRRGPKPAKSTEAKPPVARKSPKNEDSRVRDLEQRLAEALKREAKTLEQQAGAADILRLIAESPADLPAVLDGILGGAIRLMGAEWGAMARFDGELFHLVAQQGATPGFLETAARVYPFAPDPDSPSTRAITEHHPVYIEDAFEASYRGTRELARAGPFRSLLSLPLLREGRGIGTINLTWADVRPFPADRIEVLKTFADQAVIAIENVRLFTETKEALEQQAATAGILRVISTSPTDLQPVFETIAENAVRLCDAAVSGVLRYDGSLIHLAAHRNFSSAVRAIVPQDYPMAPTRRRMSGRAILDRTVVHVPDVLSDPHYPQEVARSTGWRSFLSVPMLLEAQAIGAVTVVRTRPGPFSDRQIELLKTFADQAVIAIENVRLFNETKEALE
jgi:two-component system, NtrC family, sensor kinase